MEIWKNVEIWGKIWKFGGNLEILRIFGNLEKIEICRKKFGNLKFFWKSGKNWKSGKKLEIWKKIGNLENIWKFEKYLESIWKFGKHLKISKKIGNFEKVWKLVRIWKFGNLEKIWKFGKKLKI